MRYPRSCLAILTAGLMAGSCVINSYGWSVPTTVAAGSVFAIEVGGTLSQLAGGNVAAILQVPNGFDVLDGWVITQPFATAMVTRDDASILAPYVAEPGHFLTSFSGFAFLAKITSASCTLKMLLRAPAVAGSHTFKLSVMTTSPLLRQPGGFTDFAQIPGNSLQVVGPPGAAAFELMAVGPVDQNPYSSGGRIQVCDFDNDGLDDVLVLNNSGPRVLLSRPGGWVSGTGNLGSSGDSAAVGDLDGDGRGDIVFGNGAVFFGAGASLWVVGPVLPHGLSGIQMGVAAGDVDGDGRLDVGFADHDGYAVFRNNGNRTFTPFGAGLPSTPASTYSRVQLEMRDLDGDGRAEIVSLVGGGLHRLWRNDGQGNWQVVGNLPPLATDVAFLDYNGDGALDLVFTNSNLRYTLTAQGLTTFPILPLNGDHLVALDQNGDGRCDLVLATNSSGAGQTQTVVLWRHQAGSVFTQVGLAQQDGFHVLAATQELATGDFNGDGFPDLVADFAFEGLMAWRSTATAALSYGDPCPAPGFAPPALTAIGTVAPLQPITLQVDDAVPNGLVLMWAGPSKHEWLGLPILPLALAPFGAPGCSLLAEPLVVITLPADAAGVATHQVTRPGATLPPGYSLFLQAAVLAPNANALGLLLTNGLAIKLQ